MPYSCTYRYPNLYEVRMIATKKDIAFVEFIDEGSATVAKDALHNYKLDGENKIKVNLHAPKLFSCYRANMLSTDHVREEVVSVPRLSSLFFRVFVLTVCIDACIIIYTWFELYSCRPSNHHLLVSAFTVLVQSQNLALTFRPFYGKNLDLHAALPNDVITIPLVDRKL